MPRERIGSARSLTYQPGQERREEDQLSIIEVHLAKPANANDLARIVASLVDRAA